MEQEGQKDRQHAIQKTNLELINLLITGKIISSILIQQFKTYNSYQVTLFEKQLLNQLQSIPQFIFYIPYLKNHKSEKVINGIKQLYEAGNKQFQKFNQKQKLIIHLDLINYIKTKLFNELNIIKNTQNINPVHINFKRAYRNLQKQNTDLKVRYCDFIHVIQNYQANFKKEYGRSIDQILDQQVYLTLRNLVRQRKQTQQYQDQESEYQNNNSDNILKKIQQFPSQIYSSSSDQSQQCPSTINSQQSDKISILAQQVRSQNPNIRPLSQNEQLLNQNNFNQQKKNETWKNYLVLNIKTHSKIRQNLLFLICIIPFLLLYFTRIMAELIYPENFMKKVITGWAFNRSNQTVCSTYGLEKIDDNDIYIFFGVLLILLYGHFASGQIQQAGQEEKKLPQYITQYVDMQKI